MPLQVIANSTLFKKDINGKTIVYHCLMAIQDPAHRIRDATFTFYIWNWNNDAASKLDSEIHEINTLCGGGRTRPDHIIRIEKDHGFYTTPDYEPLMDGMVSTEIHSPLRWMNWTMTPLLRSLIRSLITLLPERWLLWRRFDGPIEKLILILSYYII
jgi:hypothetical protein